MTGPDMQQGWDDQAAHYTVRRVRHSHGALFFRAVVNAGIIVLGACLAGVVGLVLCPLIAGLLAGAAQVAVTLP